MKKIWYFIYPIHYEETIYLPIRSISSLLNIGISWDGETNSICLGGEEMDEISAETITEFVAESNEEITAYLNEDIKIYQNEELYIFEEIDGKVSYPLSYNGTTYLSVSEISKLFNVSVTNDAEESKIIIVKEENNTFSGKYISNVDGYTEVILTPNEEGFNFYLRGYKLGAGFAGKGNASVSGDVGTYELDNFETEEKDKIEFRMVDSKLVITVTNEEHNSFVGEYLLDDGKENAVVLSNPNAISGIYEGEKAKLELVEIEKGLLDAAFTGSYGEDGFFFTGAVLNYENGIATFEEEVFDYVNKLTITVNDETIEVEAYSTEEDSVYQYLSGTYEFTEKKVWDFEECKKHAEEIFVEFVILYLYFLDIVQFMVIFYRKTDEELFDLTQKEKNNSATEIKNGTQNGTEKKILNALIENIVQEGLFLKNTNSSFFEFVMKRTQYDAIM